MVTDGIWGMSRRGNKTDVMYLEFCKKRSKHQNWLKSSGKWKTRELQTLLPYRDTELAAMFG
jgi:hypothetical protein